MTNWLERSQSAARRVDDREIDAVVKKQLARLIHQSKIRIMLPGGR
jgi:hypothetical protein